MVKISKQRLWEIDFLRGLAIIMMIIFHFFYDLNYFGVQRINFRSDFWWIFGRMIATSFILLVGISLTLSYSRVKKHKTGWKLFKKYLLRGLKIFGFGLIITLITWVFLKRGFIIFGILHLIGVSIILAYSFLKLRFWNILLGVIFILTGMYIENLVFNSYWLVWVGLKPYYFYTVDYFPIFPWFGVILFGLFLGNLLYPNGKRRLKINNLSDFSFIRLFCFLGRNSLFIYLIHQPILVVFLYLFVL
jgi:uncharacterized membrane protein